MALNYEQDIEIDGEALDQEWLAQPSFCLKYGRHSAKMKKRLEEAKQNLDIAKAEADKSIRSNPEKYGIEKVTETVVANAILKEDGYQEAYTAYLNSKYEAEMAQAAVNAFEHRKSALENLVRLYGQQYFSGPTVPYQINRDWEKREQEKKVDEKVSKGFSELQRTRKMKEE